eukprot:gene10921-12728_t
MTAPKEQSFGSLCRDEFPKNLSHLILCSSFRGLVNLGDLPANLELLEFGVDYRGSIIVSPFLTSSLPSVSFDMSTPRQGYNYKEFYRQVDHLIQSNVTVILRSNILSFPNKAISLHKEKEDIDYDLDLGHVPVSITRLRLTRGRFSEMVCGYLHSSITHLTFGDHYQVGRIGPNMLPKSLTHLTFGSSFNYPIMPGYFPKSLTHITFGDSFNMPIPDGCLPSGLTHLVFGWRFQYPVDPGCLPSGLKVLEFGKCFDQEIKIGALPSSLTHLTLGGFFNRPIRNGVLPAGLTHLILPNYRQLLYASSLPDSLTHLQYGGSILLLHCYQAFSKPLLTSLHLGNLFRQVIELDNLPETLKELEFGTGFRGTLRCQSTGGRANRHSNLMLSFNWAPVISKKGFRSLMNNIPDLLSAKGYTLRFKFHRQYPIDNTCKTITIKSLSSNKVQWVEDFQICILRLSKVVPLLKRCLAENNKTPKDMF